MSDEAMPDFALPGCTRPERSAVAGPAPASPAWSVRRPAGLGLSLFGASFFTGSAEEALALAASGRSSRPRLIVTANVDHIVVLSENAAFRRAYAGATLRTLDGMPLVWLARLKGATGAQRITGHDLMASALAQPQAPGRRIFLIAASAAGAEALARRFVDKGLPPEAIAWEVPPFGFEANEAYSKALAARIADHGTTLLVMGVGAPKSEIWVDRHGALLGDPVVLAVGEALDGAAGLAARAPAWMQPIGLEWLFRFARAPRRLFARYFLRSWRFLWILAGPRRRAIFSAHRLP